jgi:hypothetical protein
MKPLKDEGEKANRWVDIPEVPIMRSRPITRIDQPDDALDDVRSLCSNW